LAHYGHYTLIKDKIKLIRKTQDKGIVPLSSLSCEAATGQGDGSSVLRDFQRIDNNVTNNDNGKKASLAKLC
jgi:hypothetical protein